MIKLKIRSDSPELLQSLFNGMMPFKGQSVEVAPGVEIVHEHHVVRQGLTEAGIIVDLVLKVASGVATKVISDWILESLKARKAQIRIADRELDPEDKTAVETAINNAIK